MGNLTQCLVGSAMIIRPELVCVLSPAWWEQFQNSLEWNAHDFISLNLHYREMLQWCSDWTIWYVVWFNTVSLIQLVSLLGWYFSLKEENLPHIGRPAQKMLVLYGSTFICQQTNTGMKFKKSKYRFSVSDDHLYAVLHISTSDIGPDFNGQTN